MKKCKLSSLPIGKEGIIDNIIWKKNVSSRLMELGFIKGEKIEMIKSSPKENVFIIRLLDYEIEIRRNACELIEVRYE